MMRSASAAEYLSEPLGPILAAGTRVGNFQILGLVGEGTISQVYLAHDLTLGRRVALKVIKRLVLDDGDIERFLAEARATASFNHPHIVTLHAVGEHEGRPYLALEYVDGGSLRTRLEEGPLPVDEALRYGRAIAEAIAEAHRHQLVHADLKPENIIISRSGRLRIVDFGLAKIVGDMPNSVSGTPAYIAPERWRGIPFTGAIDVWAFGIMLHELITGCRPISDLEIARLAFSNRPHEILSLPSAPWAKLVRDCLAIAPAARPTAEDLVGRITTLLDPCASMVPERCPFPGLAAFSRGGAADYFGRDAELDTLVEQLGPHALIPVVGPSGIGKSSLIRAGLFPRLERTGSWVTISLGLDGSPFHRLAAALGSPDQTVGELAESLREDPDCLSLALRNVAKRHDAQVLLFLDKFEELCKLAAPQDDLMAFCDCLARATSDSNPWRIVLALRDDFLDRLTAVPSMRPHLPAVMVLGPLSRANLSAAIYGPLANVNYRADIPELVTHIVDEIAEQPACLPLLQLTCKALWERRDVATRQILTIEYKAMGGATGALGTYAQGLVADLTHEEAHLVRRMLLSLVHPDGTRRRRLRTEVLDGIPAASRPVARALLDRLLDRRLVVAAQDSQHNPAQLEIVHEALAMAWPQLGMWFDETYEGFNMTYEERP